MSRYNSRTEVDVDARHDDRRSNYGGRRHDDRFEADINFRTGSGALPTRERESIVIKERDEVRTPAFLREDYGQTTAGAMVLRARDREDVIYAPRRQRSPSPRQERDEIIIRREERSESRPPAPRARPREQSREREEIIIRRDERSDSRPPAPRYRGRDQEVEREEIIIRREERDDRDSYAPPRRSTTAPPREVEREREEIIIRRDEIDSRSRIDDDLRSQRSYRPPPPPSRNDYDREEIIIRREKPEVDDRSYRPPPPPSRNEVDRQEIIIRREQQDPDNRSRVTRSRYEEDMSLTRPISHERARGRSHSSASEDEIIIRREQRDDRGRESTRQEIIIRKTSRSRSPSPTASVSTRAPPAPMPAPEPQVIYAPQIHQEVITHHRHIDHGYEVQLPPRRQPVYSRPPSPPSPPPPPPLAPASVREQSEERIEIRRSETRNGRNENENTEIIISRKERSESRGPPPSRARERSVDFREEIDYSSSRGRDWEQRNISEEAEYYNDRAVSRGYPGEAYHGATRDWGLVDVPPGTRRVRMDGAGGGAQEVSWQRYNGNRRAKFLPNADMDEGYTSDPGRPMPRSIREPEPQPEPVIANRFGARRDPRDRLWTEVTKDLVVKEAILEMGYEYQEDEQHYYIFKYMQYVSAARFVNILNTDHHHSLMWPAL